MWIFSNWGFSDESKFKMADLILGYGWTYRDRSKYAMEEEYSNMKE